VSKGEETRQDILEDAMRMSSMVGLGQLSFGRLASGLGLSKSGLFAHFGSKEALQLEVIRAAAERFVQRVIVPAVRRPRGVPRLRALFANWLEWAFDPDMPGGCIFVQAATELDDRPGAVRDALVQTQRDWLDNIALAARIAVEEGHFKAGLDTEQFAFDAYALMLGCHHFSRLLADPKSAQRARAAFETLLDSARR
jgi:AcrR family transcriptional regulator